MNKKVILLALLALSSTAVVRASEYFQTRGELQAQGDTITLTVEQAVEIAVSENPTIKVAGQEIERQEYVRKETVGNLLPSLSGSGTYNYNLMLPVMFMPDGIFGEGTGGAMEMGYAHSYTGTLSLSVPLYVPTVYQALKINDEQMRQAVEQARQSKITLANSVRKSYYAVLLSQASIDLIVENIALAEQVVKNSEEAFNQGLASEYDLITAKVQLSNLTPTKFEAETALYNTKLMLNMLLGLPLQTPLKFEEDLTSFVGYIEGVGEYNLSLEDNSDLRLLDIQANMLEYQLKMQKAAKIPTIAAFGQYSILTQADDFDFGSYDWKSTAAVGLQLNIPIFSGFMNNNKEKQIKNQQSQLDIQKDYLEESLNVEVQSAITSIENAKKQMEANLVAKEQAVKGYSIAKTRYENDMGTIVDLNSAQVQLIQADMNYVQSIYNCMSAHADYEKAIGANF